MASSTGTDKTGPMSGTHGDKIIIDALARALTRQLMPAGQTGELTREQLGAASRGDVESACRLLVKDSAFIAAVASQEYRDSLVLEMAWKGDAELLFNAVHFGGQVNCVGGEGSRDEGVTPLMLASRHGCAECVTLLLRCGASVGTTSKRGGTTALHEACGAHAQKAEARHEEVAVVLIEAGADPCARDDRGWSSLDALRNRAPPASISGAAGPLLPGFSPGFLSGGGSDKKKAELRISLLLRGQLPTSHEVKGGGQPAFYDRRRWTETSHRYMPPQLRQAVVTLLLHSGRCTPHETGWLPPDLWIQVFRYMDRAWVRPAAPPQQDESQLPPRPRPAGGASCRAEPDQGALESELKNVRDSLQHLSLLIQNDASAEPIVGPSLRLLREKEQALVARKEDALDAPVTNGTV